jgi:GT2 family glycosyltransferase
MSRLAPMDVLHLDLAGGLPDGLPLGERPLFVVFWRRDLPLGCAEVRVDDLPMPAARLAGLAARTVAPAVGDRLFAGGFRARRPELRPAALDAEPEPPPLDALLAADRPLAALAVVEHATGPRPSVSVVICTRDRPSALARCLDALAASELAPDEVLVVDNAPASDAARPLVTARARDWTTVAYLREDRPGLSVARNTGVRASSGEVVAFTDDDAVVHPAWLSRLLAGFVRPQVMAVTGLVLPANLDGEEQVLFEKRMGGFGRGFRALEYDFAWFQRLRQVGAPVWRVGAGVNMAIRRAAFDLVGLFDERLGAGAAGCSEDSELWYRLLAEGWACRYEPAAVVFHHHREAGVRRQARDYARGHLAALFVQYARYHDMGNLRRAAFALPRHFLIRGLRDLYWRRSPGTLPAELAGYLAGLTLAPSMLREAGRPRGRKP